MHELRVDFYVARFLNGAADYAKLFRMQAMLAIAYYARASRLL
jgi:hypothetical protein